MGVLGVAWTHRLRLPPFNLRQGRGPAVPAPIRPFAEGGELLVTSLSAECEAARCVGAGIRAVTSRPSRGAEEIAWAAMGHAASSELFDG